MSGWIYEIPMVLSYKTFTLQPYGSFFENFHQKWKNASCGAQFRYFKNQVSKKSFFMFEDIDLQEFHAKLHKKPSETLGVD